MGVPIIAVLISLTSLTLSDLGIFLLSLTPPLLPLLPLTRNPKYIQHQRHGSLTPASGSLNPQTPKNKTFRAVPHADHSQIAYHTMPIPGIKPWSPALTVRGLISSCLHPALLYPCLFNHNTRLHWLNATRPCTNNCRFISSLQSARPRSASFQLVATRGLLSSLCSCSWRFLIPCYRESCILFLRVSR